MDWWWPRVLGVVCQPASASAILLAIAQLFNLRSSVFCLKLGFILFFFFFFFFFEWLKNPLLFPFYICVLPLGVLLLLVRISFDFFFFFFWLVCVLGCCLGLIFVVGLIFLYFLKISIILLRGQNAILFKQITKNNILYIY